MCYISVAVFQGPILTPCRGVLQCGTRGTERKRGRVRDRGYEACQALEAGREGTTFMPPLLLHLSCECACQSVFFLCVKKKKSVRTCYLFLDQ